MIDKQLVYIVLRSSPAPLNHAGLMALVHARSNSQESLGIFAKTEAESLDEALGDLAREEKIKVIFTESALYEAQ